MRDRTLRTLTRLSILFAAPLLVLALYFCSVQKPLDPHPLGPMAQKLKEKAGLGHQTIVVTRPPNTRHKEETKP